MKIKNIGFVSTRIAGTDGVSLEIEKWASILERNGFNCFYFAGELDREPEKSYLCPIAHFNHPEIEELNEKFFGVRVRDHETSLKVSEIKEYLKIQLYDFVKRFDIDLLIPENALTIPMNIPLGLALTEFIAETCFPTIAHHHDFYWERTRFLINSVKDYLDRAFPPDLKSIQHVVINSLASEQLSLRKGISNVVIPNVFDFSNSAKKINDKICHQIRELAGLENDDLFVLQPTRIVPRKWIERAVEIVHLMKLKNPKLVISHAKGDEGDVYYVRVKNYAKILGVEIVGLDEHIGTERCVKNGKSIFTIKDAYQCCDIVTYPSGYEGFGNAFLETIYFKKPIIVNRYSIFITDIEPYGFDVFKFDGFVTEDFIEEVLETLNNKDKLHEMVEKNYEVAKKYFSFDVLEKKLLRLIENIEEQCL
ncbi:glycosyltransferase family 4 protein [Deferribacter autotrophicus]|uniref:Glycosyltransferase family 4 protein n=1 Tax=Deferribacter autotrophicus TaxID=500465 RepID=A0A5A8F1Y5_9BACT|nr:glycosyltransferase family 4 protein [Deferribacter autotrophicus]KAA0257325.1 glycosyltransferase family 4 protein [Deferribacter autotrophicus]